MILSSLEGRRNPTGQEFLLLVYTTSTNFVPADLAQPTPSTPGGQFFPDFSLPELLVPIFSPSRGAKTYFQSFLDRGNRLRTFRGARIGAQRFRETLIIQADSWRF